METVKKQSKYLFKVLWSKTDLGIAINEIRNEDYSIPISTYYFWPREDGWKLLQTALDSKPWMEENAKIEILNGYTMIVNYWLANINKNITLQNFKSNNLNLNIDILSINSMS